MNKIPTVFVRDFDTQLRFVKNQITPGCEWVFAGEGVPTRKYDGTCCFIRGGRLYKRYDLKPGKQAPADFEEVEHDPKTGKTFGWVPVGDGSDDKWHREGFTYLEDRLEGTYELVGPKVQGNPEGYAHHQLIRHEDAEVLKDVPLEFNLLSRWLQSHLFEGIVWHHPDGKMAKLKKKDFPRA